MRRSFAFSAAVACVALGAVSSCASKPDDGSAPRLVLGPISPDDYQRSVHVVLERRCGSLDCHGRVQRGLRVYGEYGLRLPNDRGLSAADGATTSDEVRATYASIVGLTPEAMNAFLLKGTRTPADVYALTVMSKGLELERHRGGAALKKGEPAEECLVTWFLGKTDATLCAAGAPALVADAGPQPDVDTPSDASSGDAADAK